MAKLCEVISVTLKLPVILATIVLLVIACIDLES
eukprot:CAMPEP_0114671198 /NCGR_PEP_ID=MMETSP0191-20121206/40744_1 /TAXON_ID=126664 /ORGANISM="Sorites sp." /LENGTH=33 /DNA_ID= /DNA_START= /DNA_END= /DNA_ORIENTATION=